MSDQSPIFGGRRHRATGDEGTAAPLGSETPWEHSPTPIPPPPTVTATAERPRGHDVDGCGTPRSRVSDSRSTGPRSRGTAYEPADPDAPGAADFVGHGRRTDQDRLADPSTVHPAVLATRTLQVDLAALDPDDPDVSRRRLVAAAGEATDDHDKERIERAFQVLVDVLEHEYRYREALAYDRTGPGTAPALPSPAVSD